MTPLVLLVLVALAAAEDCLYSGFDGVCKDKSLCAAEGGAYVTGLCGGGASNICCLPKSGKPPICDNGAGAKGACVIESSCGSGQLFSGKCIGYPSDVRCCVNGPRGVGMEAPVPPPGASADGWLRSAGSFRVERIDAASRLRFFSNHRSPVNKFLLHTIEGGGPPFNGYWEGGRSTLDSKSFWPHFIVAKDRSGQMRIGQFLSLKVEGRACRSPGNSIGTIQVEIGGKAELPFTNYPDLWEPVRALFQAVRAEYPAIANAAPVKFEGSNRAYGTNAPTRVSESRLRSMSGVIGHQHVPSNTHWDPGAIDPSKLLCVNRLCSATPDADEAPVGGGGDDNNDDTPVLPDDDPSRQPIDESGAGEPLFADAPVCQQNGVAGYCRNSGPCRNAGGTPRSNSPPAVSGCGHIADADVQCCVGAADQEPESNAGTNTGTDSSGGGAQPDGPVCTAHGVAGTCVETAVCAAAGGGRQAFSNAPPAVSGCGHIPSATVQCCAAAAEPVNSGGVSSGAGAGCAAYAGLMFPLEAGSLSQISVNWGYARSGGRRCHAGLDIYTGGARRVQAVADGVVVAIMRGWYSCSGGSIDAIMVYHSSGPLAGKTLNYGEVNPSTYTVRVGDAVRQGQNLGVARNCGMLHFEVYQGRRTANSRWYPAGGSVGAGCARTSMRTKPAELVDPRDLVRCTMPAGAAFRHGVSFLADPTADELSLFSADGDETEAADFAAAADDAALGAGAIVGIALALVAACALGLAGAYACVLRRTRRPREAGSIAIENPLHADAPDAAYAAHADSLAGALGVATLDRVSRDRFATAAGTRLGGAPHLARTETAGALDGDGQYACELCGKRYHHADDLASHVALRHP